MNNDNDQVFNEKKAIEEGLKLYPSRDIDEDTVQSNPELWKYVEQKRKEFYQEKKKTC